MHIGAADQRSDTICAPVFCQRCVFRHSHLFRRKSEMPIPPALAARLAKRGLMKDASVQGFDPATGKVRQEKSWKGGRSFPSDSGGDGKTVEGMGSYGYEEEVS